MPSSSPPPAIPLSQLSAPNSLQVEIDSLHLQLAELLELYEWQVEAEQQTISRFEREMGELKAELLTLRAVIKDTLAKEIRAMGEDMIAAGDFVRCSPSPAPSEPAPAKSAPAELATPDPNSAPASTTEPQPWEFGSFVSRLLFSLQPNSVLK